MTEKTCEHCGRAWKWQHHCPSKPTNPNSTHGVTVAPDASAWWALVMGAAASIEDAANCLRDPDAKKQAEGAAKHYRDAAQKLIGTGGVQATDRSRDA